MATTSSSLSSDMHTNNSLQTATEFRSFLFGFDTYLAIRSITAHILLPFVSTFGIFANVANIVVFAKMGFLETTNMFLALSIGDLIVLLSYVLSVFFGSRYFAEDINTLFWVAWDLVLLVNPFTWAFVGYGSCTTALIAVERSVCIALPLKVKSIFTPKRITTSLLCLLGFPLGSLVMKYANTELKWVTSPATNESRLVFNYNVKIDLISALAFSNIPSWIAFVIVAVGTAFMVTKLNQNARWRKTSAQSTQKTGVSTKEVNAIKSVVIVCSVFIVCFTPNGLVVLAGLIYPPFHLSNPYFGPLALVMLNLSHLLQAISSSVNICIYLTTSSKYKHTFANVFNPFTGKA